VLAANDGIVSVAAIIVGVAAAQSGRSAIITAGMAGLVAGAASMAAGEYVSVSSQADAERADLRLERRELLDDPDRCRPPQRCRPHSPQMRRCPCWRGSSAKLVCAAFLSNSSAVAARNERRPRTHPRCITRSGCSVIPRGRSREPHRVSRSLTRWAWDPRIFTRVDGSGHAPARPGRDRLGVGRGSRGVAHP
jgi:VIT family